MTSMGGGRPFIRSENIETQVEGESRETHLGDGGTPLPPNPGFVSICPLISP
jgi:hypothetical protein